VIVLQFCSGWFGRKVSMRSSRVNVIEPETEFGDRVNQLDLRIGKLLRFGNTRSVVSVDVFNLLNNNAVTR
jgi:hypothetical protein